MTTTFITGANKSLGFETARRLVEAGHTVLLGARDAERGRAAAASLGARFVRIDVTDDASVRAAAADVAAHEGTVDVLVNNAGVLGRVGPVEEYTAADMSAVLDVNVVGIVRVTHAFLPLLRTSPNPVIVNVASGMGSFGMTQDPERVESRYSLPLYSASKAAVTMLTTRYARELKDVKVNAADPGQTATDFTGGLGHSVADGAESIVTLATIGPDGPTGRFVDRAGNLPW
ncbi:MULTISPECIES: SDR family NAD(P)-dependent oxidoreductase [Streptomyces]|uniref:SDR family NAD(P)-dependent oxidoreductase n=1 Tax=Streptomyces doudnae TaxID=3075536 RepID=A0ABD5EMA4_9ACTN|nr:MULTISPECIES: SDR family NAD(P)-dependent oxidoreductase [unclassified Streptomyces]MDT0435514.1 SDR family NAD(P)-dependent oxidoreductase [Streptomyces sp. DSM 41981]MYQ64314.1 SDR family NAD(P)-dependent oxidoreductase [Streptomyces sp. SID4950]SCD76329.1 Short-chain dehydrogenase [Streptomyces sp. SolWspMP-5a-2]